MRLRALTIALAALATAVSVPVLAQEKSIVVASTTSTRDSGLFDHILPLFTAKTGIDVRVLGQGTGQALDTGRRGDADVVFVHAKPAEEKFLAEGQGVKRYPVMYNDFILVGPRSDPAGVKGTKDILAALKAIKVKNAVFMSRGDVHQAELKLWKLATSTSLPRRGLGTRTSDKAKAPGLPRRRAPTCCRIVVRGCHSRTKRTS
jgi:tungstate transport system substrate-binding protein